MYYTDSKISMSLRTLYNNILSKPARKMAGNAADLDSQLHWAKPWR